MTGAPHVAVDSPIWNRLHDMGGAVEVEELRYSLSRRGLELDPEHLDDLIEKGLVERVGDDYQAVVPARVERRGGDTREQQWSDEELLDRVRLWALIVGKPPTQKAWTPAQLTAALAPLQRRIDAWDRLLALYQEGDWPSEGTIRERFGSMNAALVMVGYEPRSPGGQRANGDVPVRVAPPKYGPEALSAAEDRVRKARLSARSDQLREALYELAVAAYTEADRL